MRHVLGRIASAALLATLLATPVWAAPPPADPVGVDLRDRASVAAAVVTVGDVAQVSGGDAAARARAAALDLADVPADGGPLTVTRRQVEFRLRVAGFAADAIRVTGSPTAAVTVARRAVTAGEVVAAATAALARRLALPDGEVEIEAVQPVTTPLPEVPVGAEVVITAEPHAKVTGPGRMQMDVAVAVGGERKLSLAVLLDARPVRTVAVWVRPLPAGTEVPADAVRDERRAVDPGPPPPAAGEVVGRKTLRALTAGHPVRPGDVAAAPAAVTVRAGQKLALVVLAGSMTLRASGEALQDARLGQPVRVRVLNGESKTVVVGRVSGPDTVDVDLGGTP